MSDTSKLRKRSKMATRPKGGQNPNVNIENDGESSEKEIELCGFCELEVKEGDKAVACEICDKWYHIKCENLPEKVYEFMGTKEGKKNLLWYCNFCSRGSVKLYNRLKALELDQEKIRTRQSVLEEEIEDVKECMEKQKSELTTRQDSVKGEIKVIKETMAVDEVHSKTVESRLGLLEAKFVNFQQEITSVKVVMEKENNSEKSYREALLVELEKKTEEKCKEVKRDMESVLVEKTTNHMQSRMDRRNNVVLHGAPEEIKEDLNLWLRSEKIKHDKAILMELCLDIEVECYADDIVEIKRVGKYKKNTGRVNEEGAPRPIIVTLKEGIKDKILRNVYKLKNTENDMLKRISVSHDMTQDERQIDMQLKLEAKKKNESESEHFFYVVRGNPWERYILKLRKKGTPKVSEVPQAQTQVEGGGD